MTNNNEIVFGDDPVDVNNSNGDNNNNQEEQTTETTVETNDDVDVEPDNTGEETTTDDVDTDSEGDDETVIDIVRNSLGLDVTDEEGNEIIFEDSPEGIAAYLSAARTMIANESLTNARNQVFNDYPAIKEAFDYYRLNGSLENFNQTPDRSNVVIRENDLTQQETIVRELYSAKGLKPDDSYIEYLRENGKLFSVAESSLQDLIQLDAAKAEQRAADIAKQEAAAEEFNKQYWGKVKANLDKGVIAGYKIPEAITITSDGKQVVKTRNDFFKYMSANVKDGMSQWHIDDSETPEDVLLEEEMLRAYLRYSKGSLKDLIKLAINDQQVKDTKKKLGFTKKAGNRPSNASSNDTVDNSQIVLQ